MPSGDTRTRQLSEIVLGIPQRNLPRSAGVSLIVIQFRPPSVEYATETCVPLGAWFVFQVMLW